MNNNQPTNQEIISSDKINKGRRILFIDRDGVLIKEVPPSYQLDSFDKLEFYPSVFKYLGKIAAEFNFELVMVTNQDGLGTASFPENTFWPIQNLLINSLKNEGIHFTEIYIDKTLPEQNAATRKPGLAMLAKYINNPDYDLVNSFVIGDRITDMQLAKNLGSKGFWLNTDVNLGADQIKNSIEDLRKEVIVLESPNWKDIYEYLKSPDRKVQHDRITNETKIKVNINLDGKGSSAISTGLPFFDHMLDQLARHGNIDLAIECKGDLNIDEHHTIEDTGLAL